MQQEIENKLNSLAVVDLKKICKQLDIKKYSDINKGSIIKKIIKEGNKKKLKELLYPSWWDLNKDRIFNLRNNIAFFLTFTSLSIVILINFEDLKDFISNKSIIQKTQFSDYTKLNVLIFPFKGYIDNVNLEVNYSIQIFTRLREKFDKNNIEVQLADKIWISHSEEEMEKFGLNSKSDIIIWGYYEENECGPNDISVRFKMLNDQNESEFLKENNKFYSIGSLKELREGSMFSDFDFIIAWMLAKISVSKEELEQAFEFLNNYKVPNMNDSSYIEYLILKYTVSMKLGYNKEGIIIGEELKKRDLKNKWNILINLGRVYSTVGKFEKADTNFRLAKILIGDDKTKLTLLYNMIAINFIRAELWDSASVYSSKSHSIALQLNDYQLLIKSQTTIGAAYLDSDIKKCEFFLTEALKNYKKHRLKKFPSDLYFELGRYKRANIEYREALVYFLKVDSFNLSQSYSNLYSKGLTKLNIAGLYYELDSLDAAIYNTKEAIKYFQKSSDKSHDLNFGRIYLGQMHLEKKHYKVADSLFLLSLNYFKSINILNENSINTAIAYTYYGSSKRYLGKYKEAVDNLIRAERIFHNSNIYKNHCYNLNCKLELAYTYLEQNKCILFEEKIFQADSLNANIKCHPNTDLEIRNLLGYI